MKKILSQILIYVDRSADRHDICAFCTKLSEDRPEIRFTYYCFGDSTISFDEYVERLKNDIGVHIDNVFVISNISNICKYTKEMGIAYAGLITNSDEMEFGSTLYWLEDIKYIDFTVIERMWRRFRALPWTITETDRLVIREQTIGDVERLFEIYEDESIRKYVDPLKETLEEEIEYTRDYINNQYRFCEFGIWVIEDRATSEIIGRAGFETREDIEGLEIGYVIDKQYRGKGYAREAVEAIINYAVSEYELDELHAYTAKDNAASIKLLLSLGFEKCDSYEIKGTLHDKYVWTAKL